MGERVPDFLTIGEAARVLRIGRTKAYAMGQEWRITNGDSGIKVCELGGQLRVPKAWLEEQLEAPVLFVPQPPERAKRNGHTLKPAPTPEAVDPTTAPPPTHEQPKKGASKRQPRKRARVDDNQLTLPFG